MEAASLSEAKVIFDRAVVPIVAKVVYGAGYWFVLVRMLGQPSAFQVKFLGSVRDAATRHELLEDAVAFAEARFRQTAVEVRYKSYLPSHLALRDEISRLFKCDQAAREREGFDAELALEVDRRTVGLLVSISSIGSVC